MIAQRVAIDSADRVLSLASIMSTTGDRAVGRASPAARAVLMARPASERAEYVAGFVDARRAIGSQGELFDEEAIRELAERAYDRGFFPGGTARQLAADPRRGRPHAAARGRQRPRPSSSTASTTR